MAPLKYEEEIRHLKKSEIGSTRELVFRQSLVGVVGVMIYLATNDPIILAWIPLFLSLNFLYYVLLHATTIPFTMARYIGMNLVFVLASTVFTFMPIYIWVTATDTAVKAAAIFAVLGHGIFSLCHHTRRTLAAFWDNVLVLSAIGAVTLYQASVMDNVLQQLVFIVGGGGVMFYYLLAHNAAINDRQDLSNIRYDMLEAMKLNAMGQITAGVAHDFNNKLTVIQGNIDLAALAHDPIDRAERLADARAAAENAADVVAHMRAFVRKSPLSVKTVNLTSFSTYFTDTTRGYLPETLDFNILRDPAAETLDTDPSLLETALLNLVLNSRDSMAQTGGTIELHIAPCDLNTWSGRAPSAPGPYLRFDMCDTGPGLPIEKFRLVQEPFYSSKASGMGTGLGLSLVKGFTEQTGGALELRNRPIGGLMVSMLLPVTLQT